MPAFRRESPILLGRAADQPRSVAPSPWLVARVPWSAAEHRIAATAADAETAAMLAIPVGSPCLVVERRTWSGNQAITSVRLSYAGDSHTLVATFAPS
jgi:GntR family histidine utilization transcriptional repressor